jgi:hypothetical protein
MDCGGKLAPWDGWYRDRKAIDAWVSHGASATPLSEAKWHVKAVLLRRSATALHSKSRLGLVSIRVHSWLNRISSMWKDGGFWR